MFNGPRAGINANDHFGGGDEIAHNLVFSSCRESGDHGPYNSWNRQPFLTLGADGVPTMRPEWRNIHHNFFVDNYSPQEASAVLGLMPRAIARRLARSNHRSDCSKGWA